MSIFEAIVLGIVQGLTEFLPISSSGHLVLMHQALGISESGLTFDVALHLGTLLALVLFFWKDLMSLAAGLFRKTTQTKLAWLIALATIPAAIIGYLLESAAESTFRSPLLVSFNLAGFGVVMLIAEKYATRHKNKTKLKDVSRAQALSMGFAQAAAVVPGISRSGSTITAGIFTGMDRVAATRFSFLLGVPIIAGAVLKVLTKDSAITEIRSETSIFIIGILTAFATGLIAIKFLLSYLSKHSLAVFAYYRIALAVVVLLIISLA
jgi:undecaprenyl-diphosphatase